MHGSSNLLVKAIRCIDRWGVQFWFSSSSVLVQFWFSSLVHFWFSFGSHMAEAVAKQDDFLTVWCLSQRLCLLYCATGRHEQILALFGVSLPLSGSVLVQFGSVLGQFWSEVAPHVFSNKVLNAGSQFRLSILVCK